MKSFISLFILGVAALSFTGCQHYVTPGEKADMQAFASKSIQEGFAIKPSNPFPASITAVRIQAPAYSNYYLQQNGSHHGTGRYSVIMTRDVEDQSQFDRIAALPQVNGLVTLNRILLPNRLEDDSEIRQAAARLRADLVLIYTFDTAFFDINAAKPLSFISLGLSPTRKITATTTVSALLMDTRTGYIYSAYEVSEREGAHSTSWGSSDAADRVRRNTEGRAFGKLIDEFVESWPKLLEKAASAKARPTVTTKKLASGL